MVAFDIDGTILDMLHAVLQLLRNFDFEHGTSHFEHVTLEVIRWFQIQPDTVVGLNTGPFGLGTYECGGLG